jgi:uncharacterized protein YbcI
MAIESESGGERDTAEQLHRREQAAAISRGMVALVRRVAGRGPTRARTTIARDHVLVLFEDSLTPGERTLVENGHRENVAAMRRGYQQVMEMEASSLVSEITGRNVRRFMSANHLDDPDLAAEIFLFGPDGEVDTPVEEGEHRSADA